MDEGDGHEAAGGEFEDGTEEDADETTPSCFEGLVELFAADEFAEDGTNEGAKNDTYCAKEKSDDNADGTTPHSPSGSAIVFGAPCRNNIVQNGDDEHYDTPYKKELPAEINAVGGLRNP